MLRAAGCGNSCAFIGAARRNPGRSVTPLISMQIPSGVDRAALDRAVSDSFRDETPDREIDTRAIVVVYNGRIVAEHYAHGFDKNSRLLGWSMSKSITAALVGTLIASGRLALDVPPPVPEWKDQIRSAFKDHAAPIAQHVQRPGIQRAL